MEKARAAKLALTLQVNLAAFAIIQSENPEALLKPTAAIIGNRQKDKLLKAGDCVLSNSTF